MSLALPGRRHSLASAGRPASFFVREAHLQATSHWLYVHKAAVPVRPETVRFSMRTTPWRNTAAGFVFYGTMGKRITADRCMK